LKGNGKLRGDSLYYILSCSRGTEWPKGIGLVEGESDLKKGGTSVFFFGDGGMRISDKKGNC